METPDTLTMGKSRVNLAPRKLHAAWQIANLESEDYYGLLDGLRHRCRDLKLTFREALKEAVAQWLKEHPARTPGQPRVKPPYLESQFDKDVLKVLGHLIRRRGDDLPM